LTRAFGCRLSLAFPFRRTCGPATRKHRMQPPKAPKTPNRRMDAEPGAREGPAVAGRRSKRKRREGTRRGDGSNHRWTQMESDGHGWRREDVGRANVRTYGRARAGARAGSAQVRRLLM
jgi:hypothetical protein